ncbi:hypothetical protein [Pedobacter foliorum]|uniref:hypothetical protein n=1 Tax=Pedobacter foliorum TaxID=2739058 RepID=UPI0015667996|nr:hypothetical protein [Pedobacter foliorum]NRF41120.1 hypothetical protein [Pedobacter foliorum]
MKPISDEAFELLIDKMEKIQPLSTRFKRLVKPILFETEYKRGSRILNFNEVQQLIWFTIGGIAREIRVNAISYSESTAWFWKERSFLYTSPGFFSQEPSHSTIEVIKDCRAVLMSYQNLSDLKTTFKETETITEKIRADNEMMRLVHGDNIRNLNTRERYLEEREALNEIFPHAKLQYIAEYMGMSVDRLGKLRKEN